MAGGRWQVAGGKWQVAGGRSAGARKWQSDGTGRAGVTICSHVMPAHAGIHPDGPACAGATVNSVVTLFNLTNLLYTGMVTPLSHTRGTRTIGAWQ